MRITMMMRSLLPAVLLVLLLAQCIAPTTADGAAAAAAAAAAVVSNVNDDIKQQPQPRSVLRGGHGASEDHYDKQLWLSDNKDSHLMQRQDDELVVLESSSSVAVIAFELDNKGSLRLDDDSASDSYSLIASLSRRLQEACQVDGDCSGNNDSGNVFCARETLQSSAPLVCCNEAVDLGTGNIVCGNQPVGGFCQLFEGDALCASKQCNNGVCVGDDAPIDDSGPTDPATTTTSAPSISPVDSQNSPAPSPTPVVVNPSPIASMAPSNSSPPPTMTPSTSAAPTAPTSAPTFEACNICGGDLLVGNPDGLVSNPFGTSEPTCAEIEAQALVGLISPEFCAILPALTRETCACGVQDFEECNICGSNMQVGNPDGTIFNPLDMSNPTCAEMQEAAAAGMIGSGVCELLPALVTSSCDCQRIAGTPTGAPSESPSRAPSTIAGATGGGSSAVPVASLSGATTLVVAGLVGVVLVVGF